MDVSVYEIIEAKNCGTDFLFFPRFFFFDLDGEKKFIKSRDQTQSTYQLSLHLSLNHRNMYTLWTKSGHLFAFVSKQFTKRTGLHFFCFMDKKKRNRAKRHREIKLQVFFFCIFFFVHLNSVMQLVPHKSISHFQAFYQINSTINLTIAKR